MMRKKKLPIKILLLSVVVFIAAAFYGCGEKTAQVESAMNINSDFSGSRSVSVNIPDDIDIQQLKMRLNGEMPVYEQDAGAFALSFVQTEGAEKLNFTVNFSSAEDYENKVGVLLAREPEVAFATPDSVMTKGVRLSEDFSVWDLIKWITDCVDEDEKAKNLSFECTSSVVSIDGKIYTAEPQINIAELDGHPIESIRIDTINNKDGNYERRFTFEVADSEYRQLGDTIQDYFESLTDERADFNGWSLQGSSQSYLVIFQNLDIAALNEVTNMMLSTQDAEIFYGDKSNASTPLSEGLDFEEQLSTLNFFTSDMQTVPLTYTYSLPSETTYADGQIYSKGQWIQAGQWQSGTFTYTGNEGMIHFKIPDGIQYKIEGINFTLQNIGEDRFVRTTDFLYSSEDGQKGQSYAYDYFSQRGANTSKLNVDGMPAVRITNEGTPLEISVQTVDLFGAGNYMNYSKKEPAYSLTVNTAFKDYINISSILNAQNSEAPIKYTVLPSAGEAVREMEMSYSEGRSSVSKPDKGGSFSAQFSGGQAEITYRGAVANKTAVRNYTLFAVLLSVLTLLIIGLLLYRQSKSNRTAAKDGKGGGDKIKFKLPKLKFRKKGKKDAKSEEVAAESYEEILSEVENEEQI